MFQNLAYEIILTLGQAFEVAYQLALQARKGGHSSTLPESFENKPSKPIPKPRVSIRKSVVSRKLWCMQTTKFSYTVVIHIQLYSCYTYKQAYLLSQKCSVSLLCHFCSSAKRVVSLQHRQTLQATAPFRFIQFKMLLGSCCVYVLCRVVTDSV